MGTMFPNVLLFWDLLPTNISLIPLVGYNSKSLSSEIIFFKDFAEKYGINFNVIRHGKFKAAVEPFIRNNMSPENKEQISGYSRFLGRDFLQKL